jgi:plasmid maintenance system antidote protein VapI
MKHYEDSDILDALRKEVSKTSQTEFASSHSLSPQSVCNLVHGRRHITDLLAAKLGYKKVWIKESSCS